MDTTESIDDPLTASIIQGFYNIYNKLGGRLPERLCMRALIIELIHRRLPYEREVRFDVRYRDVWVGTYRADLIVSSTVVVECKSVATIVPAHVHQLHGYLALSGLTTGLILNFGDKPEVRRVVR